MWREYWLRIAISAFIVVLVVFWLGSNTTTYMHQCRECLIQRIGEQWRWGHWRKGDFALGGLDERYSRAAIYEDFFDTNHEHVWEGGVSGVSAIFFGASIDGGYHSGTTESARAYLVDPGFRDFVQAGLAEGKLIEEDVNTVLLTRFDMRRFQTLDEFRANSVNRLADELIMSYYGPSCGPPGYCIFRTP